mgnify:CR=1 FL=1
MSTAAAVPERIMPTGRKAPCSGFTPAVRPISVPPISIRRSAATAATSAISSLRAKAAESFSPAGSLCTQEALDAAEHTHEIVRLDDAWLVNVDCAQAGVGGTDSWSVKSRPSEAYRLLEKHYGYEFVIAPAGTPADAARTSRRVAYKNE